ncbi:DUF1049 domain-containing protein [Pseudomonas sp. WS 5106]|uniref:DUF1049 domain-containing protein n=1 Tax=Pseudomonas cremoris TaxID=2724178 RepID=A0A7X1AM37_9PSED|nr:lipopolysaccharide assembly protein LapA domain-containing protein [Pseudomonas cremoris]MBC2382855.1 DUF1049 domain-containing protein [Pseudomonas cremoris]MBC2406286.1 DUF1049 domain-containing protein [Pseudomonas cremoris]MBC2406922.1 DUF1049 domain-containing protein [Pseudomonas cremoris]
MRGVKRVVVVIVLSIVVLAILAFVLENQQGAVLSFFGWTTFKLPVSVLMVLSLIIGLITGPIVRLLLWRDSCFRKFH